MKIYLAGPIRGKPQFNYQAFDTAAYTLRKQGHEVFNPIEYSRSIYGDDVYTKPPAHGGDPWGVDGRVVFAADLLYICKEAEAIALLPGWEHSQGSRAEHAVAQVMQLKFIYL